MEGKVKCRICKENIRQGDDLIKIEVYERCIFKRWMVLCAVCGSMVLNDMLPKMKMDFESSLAEIKAGIELESKSDKGAP